MTDITRKFGNEKYSLVFHYPRKKRALDCAKRLRKKGFKARVIKAEYTLGCPWSVFKGKKKRKKK